MSSTSSADGHTHLRLGLLPKFQEGDLIHLRGDDRVIATALITEVDVLGATALVTGLTDRTRAVAVGDIAARMTPGDLTTASTAAGVEATTTATIPASAPPVIAPIVPLPEHPPSEVVSNPAHVAPPTEHAVLTPTPEELAPDVRARLTAERAYFDLATQVLRLPVAGPELIELQQRLRIDLADLELLP